jgi:hypothetical protein
MYLVDGVWWNSKARLPDPRLVLRRNLDAGTELTPWQISQACGSPEMTHWVDQECGEVKLFASSTHSRRSARTRRWPQPAELPWSAGR